MEPAASEHTTPGIIGIHHISVTAISVTAHSGIRTGEGPVPFATVPCRDPDNVQLELFAVG